MSNGEFSEMVTVIINNKDLLNWPRSMCQKINQLKGLEEIIILDNGSTNKELLNWYKECDFKVIFLENLGHTAPWSSGVLERIKTNYYIVTDPDLDIIDIPDDVFLKMIALLSDKPELRKVGLSLKTADIPEKSPYFQHVNNYEVKIQSQFESSGEYMLAPVDTTFALYDKRISNAYEVSGVRLPKPYEARHLPWYIIDKHENLEFSYYIDNANSDFSSYKKYTKGSAKTRLEYLYRKKSGKVSTKWNSYFEIYERHLDKFKNDELSLLEIGVQNGGSLDIWAEYFRNAKNLVGCDINPKVSELKYEDNRIKVIGMAATNPEAYANIINIEPNGYDIIIDDGSHRSMDTLSNFINYFDVLKPGGLFIIEDMHCAYWEEYGGGFFNELSISNFMKKILDLINIEHCRNDFDSNKLFKSFFIGSQVPKFLTDNSIYSISAYNSIYIIEKSSEKSLPLLGEVVIVGDVALIDDRVLGHRK